MNADELIAKLRDNAICEDCEYYGEPCGCNRPVGQCVGYDLCNEAADLIESLQAQLKLEHGGALAAAENCLRLQGEVNDLQARLAKEKRRAEKAVEDLAFACGSQPNTSDDCSICDICKYKQNDGSCPKQCFMNSLGASNRWQWRGDAEEGDIK